MVRQAFFAGSWYPKDGTALKKLIESAIEDVSSNATYQKGPYRFGVLPHAGLFYSKMGIAPFFAAPLQKVERIVVISPSHYAALPLDTLVSSPLEGCETPLGLLESFSLQNAQQKWFSAIQSEHALEMVLPFIASMAPSAKVALAMVSHYSSYEMIEKIAHSLIKDRGKESLSEGRTVLIASSDFTHYGPRFGYTPYKNAALQKVKEDDLALSRLLCEGRINEALGFCMQKRSTVCGYAPALLVAFIANLFQSKGWVADYYTSLDISASTDANFVAYSTILWR